MRPPTRPASPRPPTGLPSDLKSFEIASLMRQGEALLAAGQFGKAVKAGREVLKRDPAHAGALVLLGRAAQKTGASEVAVSLFTRVLAADAGNAAAHAGLGDTQAAAHDWAAAVASFRRATALSPKAAGYQASLGAALIALGQRDAAAASFRRAIALEPRNKLAGYMLGGLEGSGGDVQASYVRAMFDGYAPHFEQHLVERLQYRIPWVLAEAVVTEHPAPFAAGLDLGCGTGLVGDALGREEAPVLDGIDLSPKMVEITRGKGRYRAVYEGDIVAAMGRPEVRGAGYDLVIAADVFIYVGALEAVFARVAEILAPDGLLAFSLEHIDGDGFAIQASSRYAHGSGYTARLAAASGFAPVLSRQVPLRQESGRDIPGRVEVWRR
jgi:predicted TPR repeat methyltransferase